MQVIKIYIYIYVIFLSVLISEVGQAPSITCLEEMFCTEPGTGKAVAGLGSGLAQERGAVAAWGLGSTGAPLMVPGWVIFQS